MELYVSACKRPVAFFDEQGLIDVLRKTSLHFEDGNTASSTVFDNLSEDYTAKLIKAIVAFEVEVEEMDNVFKLSQNRNRESYRHIMQKLSAQDTDGKVIAEEMRKREEDLFSDS